jgi:hypothetical protein
VRLAPDVALEVVDGSAVVLHLSRCEYFDLNQVATRIVQLVESGTPSREVARVLASEYEVEPERVEADVADTIAELVDLGILSRDA